MIQVGDRVLIQRQPTSKEDPDQVWMDVFEQFIGLEGTVLDDTIPLAQDSLYASVEVDDFADFYLPIPILSALKKWKK